MKKALNNHWVLRIIGVALGLFFIYAGAKKLFIAPAPRTGGPSTVPAEFIDLIRALKTSGYFMIMVAWFQLTSGVLLIWDKTRLIGALALLPITFNIFVMHVILDNRWDENLLTGVLFLANVWVILPHLPRLYNPKLSAA
ncbi:MAG TPA: hypothetical protein VJ949_12270 [Cryomorphaceae bacterium]|nr:hypothetical protein [Cryomorphaceae bacterium]